MKRIITFLTICLAFALFTLSIAAAPNDTSLPRVIDDAGLLSHDEEVTLENRIAAITEEYDFDVVILTVNSIGIETPAAFADDYYDYIGYGCGDNSDGMLLLLAMESRDYYTSTTGKCISIFTDYGIANMSESFVSYLSGGDYYGGFSEYLSLVDDYAYEYENHGAVDTWIPDDDVIPNDSNPVPSDPDFEEYLGAVVLSLIISLVIAIITVLIMRSGMNNVTKKHAAMRYITADGLNITKNSDIFLYRTVSRVRRQTESNSGGGHFGGSSTHIGSSGRSHGGGGGKF